MKEQVKICIQGGIAKDNGKLDLYKVQAIYIIPMLKDSKSRQKKDSRMRETAKKEKEFGALFEKACDDVTDQNIVCRTKGYTKEAKSIEYHYESKEYNV